VSLRIELTDATQRFDELRVGVPASGTWEASAICGAIYVGHPRPL
jgi:hypothetical protein